MGTDTFTTPGSRQEFTVPANVTQLRLLCAGAGGADGQNESNDPDREGLGASGGSASAIVSATPGETLYVRVGGAASGATGGFNLGGDGATGGSSAGGGGGASDVRRSGDTLSDRLCVGAGGGGGATGDDTAAINNYGAGGRGGGTTGESGGDPDDKAADNGGTQSTAAQGGTGEVEPNVFGGGGGGGVGGGGGGAAYATNDGAQGGGGGASLGDSTTLGGGNAGDGDVTIEYVTAPSNLTATAIDGDQIDLSWTDNSTDEDGFRVYRSTDPGVTTSDTQVADLAAGTTSYSDTGLLDGTEYHYIVTAYKTGGPEEPSTEDSAITGLPAPTALASPTQADTAIDITWTDNHDNGQTRVDYKLTTDGSYTTFSTLAVNTESETITGLLNGETYDIRVVALTDDASTVDT